MLGHHLGCAPINHVWFQFSFEGVSLQSLVSAYSTGRVATYLGASEISTRRLAQGLTHCFNCELSVLLMWAADGATDRAHVEALD